MSRNPFDGARDEEFLEHVVAWGRRQADVVAVVLTGSRAREGGAVDPYSDYDIELFTDEPAKYEGVDWVSALGPLWVCLPQTSDGHPTRLCFFEGGVKADFTIVPAVALERMVERQSLSDLWQRGYRVLFDRTGLATRLPIPSLERPVTPPATEHDYLDTHTVFWFEAAHIPRYLLREELWVVKFRDFTMKQALLKMLEWHATATGDDPDVWHIGTNAKTWTSPAVWERLHETFARFDAADSWRALLATLSLFHDVSGDVAACYGFPYPRRMDDAITSYVRSFERVFRSAGAVPPPRTASS